MKTQKIYLEITETYNYKLICGRENGNYTVKISKSFPNWYFAVCDLMDFYGNTNIEIICNTTEENIILAKNLYGGHKFDERKLRDYEPKVLVHSTIKEYSDLILSCGFVKCWNLLKQELKNWEETPIGELLGDISDFSNYVMLSDVDFNNEIIVLSRQKGKIKMDENESYIAGCRFYFDAEKLAKDGLLLRDGEHLKVRHSIPIDKYMIWYSMPQIISLEELTTPKEFFEKSNKTFFHLYPQYA